MTAETKYQRGVFVKYRATTGIHLLERIMQMDEECEFDGMVLKWAGDDHTLPSMKGAVKDGWLVPADDVDAVYVPKSADIMVGPADRAGSKQKTRMPLESIEDEQLVGTVEGSNVKTEAAEQKGLPRKAAGRKPKAKRAAPTNLGGKKRKKFQVEVHESQDGVPIARLKNPAIQNPVIKDGSAAQREIRRLDNAQGNTPIQVEKIAAGRKERRQKKKKIASGDVEEAITGRELPELLPDAIATKKPPPGVRSDKDFMWDIRRPWKTRLKEALVLAETSPDDFRHLLALETTKMKHHIRTGLRKQKSEG